MLGSIESLLYSLICEMGMASLISVSKAPSSFNTVGVRVAKAGVTSSQLKREKILTRAFVIGALNSLWRKRHWRAASPRQACSSHHCWCERCSRTRMENSGQETGDQPSGLSCLVHLLRLFGQLTEPVWASFSSSVNENGQPEDPFLLGLSLIYPIGDEGRLGDSVG